jgi:hypothetical protein
MLSWSRKARRKALVKSSYRSDIPTRRNRTKQMPPGLWRITKEIKKELAVRRKIKKVIFIGKDEKIVEFY